MARYPQIRLELRTTNPLVLIAAVRQALRRAGVGHKEIAAFSRQAFSGGNTEQVSRICRRWVELE